MFNEYIGVKMIIREARKEDAKWILQHRIGMFVSMGESEDFITETKHLTEQYLKEDWMADYRYFLVEENETIIGGCGLSTFRIPPMVHQKTGIYAYLSNMYVEPEYRGKGIGRSLLRKVIETCRNDGIGLILLHASNFGHYLYESMGFESPKGLMHLITGKHSSISQM